MMAMKVIDPVELNQAVAGLFQGWVGVIATLKVEFARTVTLGASIGEMLFKPCHDYIVPAVEKAFPSLNEEHRKWLPIILQWACKAIAVSIAWWIQRVLSAAHSSLRGGKMFGAQLVHEGYKRGLLKKDEKDSNFDEIIGWALAVVGFLWQFMYGFHLPMLLRLFTFPAEILEGFITWEVMTS
eukprot:NODE_1088_length_1244_cov_153.222035.p1 GENE.NODE_1088_length_1244_cov_153.222035~~NODE_1088_length_1244_cov_153.222035.p1  ORF type:complete len:183 (+),score=57.80 NODE_1088_length_1244_cov_153.222035:487-1035(+)